MVDVLMRFTIHMVWGNGRISGGAGGVSSHTRFEIGDGSNIRFCCDVVWGLGPEGSFSELFLSLARCKDASMANHLVHSSDPH